MTSDQHSQCQATQYVNLYNKIWDEVNIEPIPYFLMKKKEENGDFVQKYPQFLFSSYIQHDRVLYISIINIFFGLVSGKIWN